VTDWKEELIGLYVRRNAVRTGSFQLGSGGTSTIYIDGRMVTTHPPALRVITQGLRAVIEKHRLLEPGDIIVAPAVSGVSMGVALALETNVDLVIDRGETKKHGMGKRFEGIDLAVLPRPKRALILDDLITQGQTLLRTIEGLRENGIAVEAVLTIVDREAGGGEMLREKNVALYSLLTKSQLEAYLQEPNLRAVAG